MRPRKTFFVKLIFLLNCVALNTAVADIIPKKPGFGGFPQERLSLMLSSLQNKSPVIFLEKSKQPLSRSLQLIWRGNHSRVKANVKAVSFLFSEPGGSTDDEQKSITFQFRVNFDSDNIVMQHSDTLRSRERGGVRIRISAERSRTALIEGRESSDVAVIVPRSGNKKSQKGFFLCPRKRAKKIAFGRPLFSTKVVIRKAYLVARGDINGIVLSGVNDSLARARYFRTPIVQEPEQSELESKKKDPSVKLKYRAKNKSPVFRPVNSRSFYGGLQATLMLRTGGGQGRLSVAEGGVWVKKVKLPPKTQIVFLKKSFSLGEGTCYAVIEQRGRRDFYQQPAG